MVRLYINFEELQADLNKCKTPEEAWDIAKDLEQRMCEPYWIMQAVNKAKSLER